ncbi:MFS transporter, partial [Escherichia coli]
GLITLILGIIWIVCFTEEEQQQDNCITISYEQRMSLLKDVLFSRIVWGMIVQYAGAMIMMIFMFTFLPLYYAKYAHLPAESSAHLSGTVNQAGILIGALLGPYFKNRGYHYKSWLFISSIFMAISAFAMLFATNDIVILVCSFLTGAIFATWFAFIFSIPKEESKNANTQTVTYSMSTFWVCTFILATIN